MGTHPKSRRDFLKTAAGTVGAGVVAAAGLETSLKTVAAAAPAAVRAQALESSGTMWCMLWQPHINAFNEMIALFKKQTGSTITLRPQAAAGLASEIVATKFIAATAAGTQPDLCANTGQNIVLLAAQGAVKDIGTSVYAANHIVISRDFVGDSVQEFTWRNKIYGVPLEADGGLGPFVNVRADLVKAKGLTAQYPPSSGKFAFDSYDQLFTLAKALQETKGGKVTRYGLCGEGWDDAALHMIMNQLGTFPFDAATNTFKYDSPAGIQAMQLHVATPVKMGIEREWGDIIAVENVALKGECAISLTNGSASLFGPPLGYDFVIAGAPAINGKVAVGVGSGQGWGINEAASAHSPNLADAFLRLVASRPGQYIYDKIYGGVAIPSWKDILFHDTSRFKPANSSNASWVLDSKPQVLQLLDTVKYIGEVGYYNKLVDACISQSQAVRLGRLTAKQGMQAIQAVAVAQYKQYKSDLANL
ncbi:MAG TPA: extracellular solute-binding protein [Chloroflexota bacterium]|jgi:ABC-type glycerol-3-phosphate transport system substrate-binding protein